MRRIGPACLIVLLGAPLSAQRVPVTLVASLTNQDGKVLPVSGRFWFVALDGRDSLSADTDGTGTARIELLPGGYRVRSHQRASLGARTWYWDVPLTVDGPAAITLSSSNAQETAPSGDVIVMDAPPPRQDAGSRRKGFWIGFGPAVGSVECETCSGWQSAGGFSIHIGGTVSPHLRIGVSSDTWVRQRNGVGHTQSNFSAVLMYFPSTTLGLRFTGGVGASAIGDYEYDYDDDGHYGPDYHSGDGEGGVGFIVGVGWEAMVARKFALTPFVSYLGGSFDRGDSYSWLFGLAATWP
jgi:hypothetical protein